MGCVVRVRSQSPTRLSECRSPLLARPCPPQLRQQAAEQVPRSLVPPEVCSKDRGRACVFIHQLGNLWVPFRLGADVRNAAVNRSTSLLCGRGFLLLADGWAGPALIRGRSRGPGSRPAGLLSAVAGLYRSDPCLPRPPAREEAAERCRPLLPCCVSVEGLPRPPRPGVCCGSTEGLPGLHPVSDASVSLCSPFFPGH